MVLGTAGSVWVKFLNFGNMKLELECFIKLAVSACLFFGIYLLVLLLLKEQLTTEITSGIWKKLFKRRGEEKIKTDD